MQQTQLRTEQAEPGLKSIHGGPQSTGAQGRVSKIISTKGAVQPYFSINQKVELLKSKGPLLSLSLEWWQVFTQQYNMWEGERKSVNFPIGACRVCERPPGPVGPEESGRRSSLPGEEVARGEGCRVLTILLWYWKVLLLKQKYLLSRGFEVQNRTLLTIHVSWCKRTNWNLIRYYHAGGGGCENNCNHVHRWLFWVPFLRRAILQQRPVCDFSSYQEARV